MEVNENPEQTEQKVRHSNSSRQQVLEIADVDCMSSKTVLLIFTEKKASFNLFI